MKAASRKPERWNLTPEAFDALLGALAVDRPAAAAKYEALRARLIKLFQWERCSFPEDRADEVMNRFARRLAEGETVERPEAYCYGIARMVIREARVEMARQQELGRELPLVSPDPAEPPAAIDRCMARCLESLDPAQRALLLSYYEGEKSQRIRNRLRLSRELGISINTLRNRALRLREKVEDCTRRCLEDRFPRDSTSRTRTND
jgi:DNA-directed RNA polymerase specialized sigma24 family protein